MDGTGALLWTYLLVSATCLVSLQDSRASPPPAPGPLLEVGQDGGAFLSLHKPPPFLYLLGLPLCPACLSPVQSAICRLFSFLSFSFLEPAALGSACCLLFCHYSGSFSLLCIFCFFWLHFCWNGSFLSHFTISLPLSLGRRLTAFYLSPTPRGCTELSTLHSPHIPAGGPGASLLPTLWAGRPSASLGWEMGRGSPAFSCCLHACLSHVSGVEEVQQSGGGGQTHGLGGELRTFSVTTGW